MRHMRWPPLLLVGAVLAGCSSTTSPAASTTTADAPLVGSGKLTAPDGQPLGTVEFRSAADGMRISVQASGLPAGWHGIHLHAVGKCEADSADPANPSVRGNFNSSGGHLSAGGDHPSHDGDLPALLVSGDGTASLVTISTRLTKERLTDPDGTALVIHERADNYANIPTRYATSGADAETKKAGDAGARIACAVVTGA